MIPESSSVFRAPPDVSAHPLGDGSDPAQGYFAADLPLLSHPQLLSLVERWMDLDATEADRQRGEGRLEAWSCLPCGHFSLIARMGVARQPGRRYGWFAHARLWPHSGPGQDFDPSCYLGHAEAFCDRPPDGGTAPVSPAPSLEPVDALDRRRDLAVGLLAHLFQAMASDLPLILAVPVADFAAESGLARAVAFARCALPTRFAARCRIRLFTRHPSRFLGGEDGMQTDLLAVPEDLAATALAAVGRRAILLDGRGARQDGPEPRPDLLDFAEAALDAALRLPDALAAFSARCDQLWTGNDPLPNPEILRRAGFVYRIAAALAGTDAQRASLIAGDLLDLARAEPDLPWALLVRPQDWARFPQDHLIRLLLRPAQGLAPGERRLQEGLAFAFQSREARVDEGLTAWWSSSDLAKRRRLLELADLEPPLVSAQACAELTHGLTVAELAAYAAPLAGALRAELDTGLLGERARELKDFARCLDSPGMPRLLLDAWESGALPAPWPDDALSGDLDPRAAELLDALMREAPEPATARLIERGVWLDWRRRAGGDLDPQTRHRLAMTWLLSSALDGLRGESARKCPPQWRLDPERDASVPLADVPMETWTQVLDDLGSLGLDEVRRLTQPSIRWPWLYPFAERQMCDLGARCATPEALAALAKALIRKTDEPAETLKPLLWKSSRWSAELPESALDDLLAGGSPDSVWAAAPAAALATPASEGLAAQASPAPRPAAAAPVGAPESAAGPDPKAGREAPEASPPPGSERNVWIWVVAALLVGLVSGGLGALWIGGKIDLTPGHSSQLDLPSASPKPAQPTEPPKLTESLGPAEPPEQPAPSESSQPAETSAPPVSTPQAPAAPARPARAETPAPDAVPSERPSKREAGHPARQKEPK
jgi:hypothetical protein